MQDALEAMKAHGYEPTTLILDGFIHRFPFDGSKDAGWYGGTIFTGDRGESVIAMGYGDWKNMANKFRFVSGNLSSKDRDKAERFFAKLKTRKADELAVVHEETAKKAAEYYSGASERGESAYVKRKQLDGLYGARIYGDMLQVPLRDIDGKLWGLQRIWPDGNKGFMKGAKVRGSFHTIGTIEEGAVVWVCEGFATGVSIHMATGQAVAVAFFASNLETVAVSLVRKFDSLDLRIAGDDDRFSAAGNTGRTAATKAGDASCASVFFPKFPTEESKGTDFNDVHVELGLETLREQLADVIERRSGYLPIGYDDMGYVFYCFDRNSIVRLGKNMSKQNLFELAPKESWEARYMGSNGKTIWDDAYNDLIQACKARGFFSPDLVRGAGVFEDDGRTVVNRGQFLIVDGKKTSIHAFSTRFIYVNTLTLPDLKKSLTLPECKSLVAACDWPHWSNPIHGKLLAGWIAFAPFGGAFHVRPPVWLIAPASTGKTTMLERVVSPWLPLGHIYAGGRTTEAGLRQKLRGSIVPVLLDELETGDESDAPRVRSIIELIRNGYSSNGAAVLKGTPSGQNLSFDATFPALVASINPNAEEERDATRFTVLEMQGNRRPDVEELKAIKYPTDCAERLFSRTLSRLPIIRASVATLLPKLEGNGRIAINLAILISFYWSLESDAAIDEATAEAMAREVSGLVSDATPQKEEQSLLAHILSLRIKVAHADTNMAEALFGENSHTPIYKASVRSYGLDVKEQDGVSWLAVAHNSAEFKRLLKGTPWTVGVKNTLLRVRGSETRVGKFGSISCRSIMIPVSSIDGLSEKIQ